MAASPLKIAIRTWLRNHFGAGTIHALYVLLRSTWRVTFDECPAFQADLKAHRPIILAHWHGDELALIQLVVRYRIATLTSNSSDGALMDGVLRRLGAATARGSSSKGGASGLRALVQYCRKGGHNVSFAVDGPRGPIYKAKPGVFEFSRLMDAPIYAMSVGISKPWISRHSWNRTALPGFFSRVHVRVVECLPPVKRDVDPRDEHLAKKLEVALNEGKRIACAEVGVDRP